MTTSTDLISEIRHLAQTRVHRVSARQLAHPETMTITSAQAMRDYLARQPEREATRSVPAGAIAAQIHQASQAAQAASEHAGAMGVPVSCEELDGRLNQEAEEKDEAHQRHVAVSRRAAPADRVQADGYFLHEDRIYKVATSQYGASKGHLFARKLDEQTGDWMPAKGMTSYLREDERITSEKAMEIGRRLSGDPSLALYGKCWICGRVLTDEISIANGKGPGPHAGMDD